MDEERDKAMATPAVISGDAGIVPSVKIGFGYFGNPLNEGGNRERAGGF